MHRRGPDANHCPTAPAPALLTLYLLTYFCLLPFAFCLNSGRSLPPPFNVVEASIADIHAAFKAKRLTCAALVDAYLARIDGVRQTGPIAQRSRGHQPGRAEAMQTELDKLFAQGD